MDLLPEPPARRFIRGRNRDETVSRWVCEPVLVLNARSLNPKLAEDMASQLVLSSAEVPFPPNKPVVTNLAELLNILVWRNILDVLSYTDVGRLIPRFQDVSKEFAVPALVAIPSHVPVVSMSLREMTPRKVDGRRQRNWANRADGLKITLEYFKSLPKEELYNSIHL